MVATVSKSSAIIVSFALMGASLGMLLSSSEEAAALQGGPANRSNYTYIDSKDTASNKPVYAAFAGWSGSQTTNSFPNSFNSNIMNRPIGFNFEFYGVSYTQVHVNENGLLYFTGGALAGGFPPAPASANPVGLPTNNINRPLIAALWADFDSFGGVCGGAPAGFNHITYETTGSSPTRVFTLRFNDWGYQSADGFTCGSGATDLRVKFYETSNIIEIYYDDIDNDLTCCPTDRQNAELLPFVIGIQKNGSDGLNYYNVNGNEESFLQGEVVRFRPPNSAPKAVDDTMCTNEGGAVTLDVVANDSDVDNANPAAPNSAADNPMTISASGGGPSDGSAVFNTPSAGSIEYTPNAGFSGSDSFDYKLENTASWVNPSDTATVTVNVNDIPAAVDDSYTATIGSTLNVAVGTGVLSNDDDTYDAPSPCTAVAMTASVVSAPGLGSLVLNSNGSFTYDPPADCSGGTSTTFTYEASDVMSTSNTATVTIAFTCPVSNTPPVADNDVYGTGFETLLSVTAALGVLDGDTDADGDPLTAVQVTGPSNAMSFTLNNDGSFDYTPNSGFSGADSFTYKANDGTADSNVATVTINVDPNNPPVADNDSYSTAFETLLSVAAAAGTLIGDTDADGDPLTAVLVSGPSNALSFTLNSDGSFDYTPNNGFSGSDSFTYKANDGNDDSNVATVTITVDPPVNNPPVADNDAYSTAYETLLSVTAGLGALNGDTDPDGDPLTAILVSGPSNALSFTLNSDGSFDYTPQNGFTGSDSFTYKANDGTVDSNVATVTITVGAPGNTPPIAVDDTPGAVPEDSLITVAVLSNDSDPDGDPLTIQSFDSSTTNGGTIIQIMVGGVPNLQYKPMLEFCGTDTFDYTIADGNGGDDTATVTVQLTCVNDPPVLSTTGFTINQGLTKIVTSGNLGASDPDDGPSDLTYTLTSLPTGGDLELSGVPLGLGTPFTQAQVNAGDLRYVNTAPNGGSDAFVVQLCDTQPTCVAGSVPITILASGNSPPLAWFTYTISGFAVTVTDSSSDPDGDIATYTFSSSGQSNILGPSGTFTFPGVGNYPIMLTVIDSLGNQATVTRVVTIEDPQQGATVAAGPGSGGGGTPGTTEEPGYAPQADAGFDMSAGPGDSVTLDGTGSQGTGLQYQWLQLSGTPVTLQAVDTATPWFLAPDVVPPGETLVFQLTVLEGDDPSIPDIIEVFIAFDGAAPMAEAGPEQAVLEGATVQLDGTGSMDPDGAPLSYHWFLRSGPANILLIDADTAMPTFLAPGVDEATRAIFELHVSDGQFTSVDTVIVDILDAGDGLAAGFQAIELGGGVVTFVDDSQGTGLTFLWDFGDGSGAAVRNPTHTFAPGTYEVTLVVSDGAESTTLTRSITVAGAPSGATLNPDDLLGASTGTQGLAASASGFAWGWVVAAVVLGAILMAVLLVRRRT